MAKTISLGRAVLVLSTEIGDFLSDLDDAGAHAGKLQKAIEGTGEGLKSFGRGTTELGKSLTMSLTGPITAVVGGLAAMAIKAAEAGDNIGETAIQAGLSAQRWQEYAFALGRVGKVSEESLVKGFAALTSVIGEASAGSEKHIGLLQSLGFTQAEIAAGMITTENAFERMRVKLVEAESPAQALTVASDLLGAKVGRQLAGAIRESNAEIDVAIQQHQALGLGMSGPALQAASDFQDQIELVTGEFAALGREIGAEVMPIIVDILIPFLRDTGIPMIRNVADVVTNVVEWFGNLPAPVQGAIAVIVGLAAAIGPVLVVAGTLITSIGSIMTAFSAVAPIVTGVGAVIAAIGAGPLTLLVGAIGGVVLAWYKWDTIKAIIGSVWTFVSDFVMNKIAPMLMIGGPLLNPIAAVVTIWKNWDAIATIVQNVYTAVKTWLVDKLSAVVKWIGEKVDMVTGFFKTMYDKVVGQSYVPDMIKGIEAEFAKLQTVMVVQAGTATNSVSGMFSTLLSGLNSTLPGGLGGIIGQFQSAFGGGGGVSGAATSMAKTVASKVLGMIPLVGPFISQFAGPIVDGFKKIGGAIKNLFGGPNADELGGRDVVAAFEKNLSKMLTDTQRLETGNESWKNTIVALRDKYREMGLSEAEALKDAERLWASSKQGAAESKRVIEEIMKKLEGGFTVPVNFDVGPLDIPGLPDVPVMPMAAGGFGHVTRPTLFLAGEGGAEDFAFSGGGKRFSAGGGGTTVIFEIDRRVMAEWLVPELPGAKVRLGIGR